MSLRRTKVRSSKNSPLLSRRRHWQHQLSLSSSSSLSFSSKEDTDDDEARTTMDLERISEEWVAKFLPSTDFMEEGYYLVAKSSNEWMVETKQMKAVRRIQDVPLGIQLEEIATSQDGQMGITIVTGVVEGGCFEHAGLQPGDSLVKIVVLGRNSSGANDDDEDEEIVIASESMECLSFDATVDRLRQLPPQASPNDETLLLTVKRLRSKPTLTVHVRALPRRQRTSTTSNALADDDVLTFTMKAGENLREMMLRNGVKLTDPLAKDYYADMGSGTCGQEGFCCHCAVSVTQGQAFLNEQGTTEEQWLAENPRWRLSCKAIAVKEGELMVRANPLEW